MAAGIGLCPDASRPLPDRKRAETGKKKPLKDQRHF
jgi:hypothetical protein